MAAADPRLTAVLDVTAEACARCETTLVFIRDLFLGIANGTKAITPAVAGVIAARIEPMLIDAKASQRALAAAGFGNVPTSTRVM